MNVLLDLNVVLDLLLQRAPWCVEAQAIWNAHHTGQITASISAASLPTIFYVVRRAEGWDAAHVAINDCAKTLEILGVNTSVVLSAQSLPGRDFEDNLQAACAIEHGCDVLVTRDKVGFRNLSIQVLTPAELLAQILQGD
ncbi:MAG: PIN domain-containing protein [Planctomycetaceae bacterium]|nr:PIN domain-containing protein [Planctomycetaceae bacterium]